MTSRGHSRISGALDNPGARQLKNRRHPGLPNLVLKCRFYHNRNMTHKILIHYSKEQVGDQTIGVRWELVVFDAVGVDITLFDLIAAYDWHPQAFPKLFRKSGFSRSRPACDDDALWFSAHVSGYPALRFSCGAGSASSQEVRNYSRRRMLSCCQPQGFVRRLRGKNSSVLRVGRLVETWLYLMVKEPYVVATNFPNEPLCVA